MLTDRVNKSNKAFLILFLIAFIYKALQFFIIPPQLVVDSNDYILISKNIFAVSPELFGLRTPFYPLLLSVCNLLSSSLYFTVAIQLLIGFVSVILLFFIVRNIANIKIAFTSSLLFLFSPLSIYDSGISTETLSIFLNIAMLFFLIRSIKLKRTLDIVLSSIILTFLIFTRPQYLLFVPAIGIYFLILKYPLKLYASIIIPLFVSLVWMFQVQTITGMFGMTILAGYNFVNHSGKWIEKAPNEYEPLKNIYIKKREETLIERGSASGIIWLMRDTLQKNLQMNKVQLSQYLSKMSFYLIFHYPFEYLRSVWASLRIALIVPDEDFRIINNSFLFRFLLPLYQLIIGFGMINGIIIIFLKNRIADNKYHLLMFILVIANLAGSILFDYGENGRFFAPSYFILFIWTSMMIEFLMTKQKIISN